jgi:hypothetical protein
VSQGSLFWLAVFIGFTPTPFCFISAWCVVHVLPAAVCVWALAGGHVHGVVLVFVAFAATTCCVVFVACCQPNNQQSESTLTDE